MKVLFFPGKNTPVKRYVSYLRGLSLITTKTKDCKVILCHSRGLANALQHCKECFVTHRIVSMDGVRVDNIPEGVHIVCFRPDHKRDLGDERMYHKIIYYKTDVDRRHHPYQIKHIRDQIVSEVVTSSSIA